MNRLAMKHTCLSFAMATLHTYIATIAHCQNFHGGTSMAWTLIRTWTTTPLNFTYKCILDWKMRENQEFPVDFVGTFLHQIWIRNNSFKKNRKKSDRIQVSHHHQSSPDSMPLPSCLRGYIPVYVLSTCNLHDQSLKPHQFRNHKSDEHLCFPDLY